MASTLGLESKVCFLTGSSRGIGWAAARKLAEEGATVILNGRSDGSLLQQRVAELNQISSQPHNVLFGDVTDIPTVQGFYREIFQRYKRLDVLVNNAGILEDALLGMIQPAMVTRVFSLNAEAVVLNMQEGARLMGRNKSGSIINLSSIIGRVGNEGQTVYAASKAAVIGATLAAAKELAPKGIRVNAVAPGFIDTDMTRRLPPAKYEQRRAGIKMGRVGTAEEVAGAVLFLASNLSSYVTGQVLGVDGGMLV
jgi:3-oxoacyl-[acyl-carrier protein] reductase